MNDLKCAICIWVGAAELTEEDVALGYDRVILIVNGTSTCVPHSSTARTRGEEVIRYAQLLQREGAL